MMTSEKEGKIIELADNKAISFLEMEPDMAGFDPARFKILREQAMFGFRTKREIMLSKRAERDQAIRVIRMVFDTPEKRREYIQNSMPKLMVAGE